MSKSIPSVMTTSFLIHSRIQWTEMTPVPRDPFEYRADNLMMLHTKLQSKFFNIPSDHRICATKMNLYVMHLLSSCIYGWYLKPNLYGNQTVMWCLGVEWIIPWLDFDILTTVIWTAGPIIAPFTTTLVSTRSSCLWIRLSNNLYRASQILC